MGLAKYAEGLSLRDVTVEYVKPASAGIHREFGVMQMTVLDLFFKNFMCPSLFAYRNDDNGADTSEKVKRMKAALSKTLDLFYPAAGRFVVDPSSVVSGYGKGEPHLVCEDAGVPFIDAYADAVLDDVLPTGNHANVRNFDISRVLELYMRGNDMFGKDLKPGNGPFDREVPEGLPALVIQVTRFKCGGVVMAPVYPHMLMDGTSFAHFMKAWSDMAVFGETAIIPDLHRPPDMEFMKDTAVTPPSAPMEDRKPEGGYARRIFEVSRSAVESMKLELQKETNGSRYVSTVDCISAHFWHALVRLGSSSTDPDLKKRVIYSYGVVNGRPTSRDPPLSRYLWGNVLKPLMHPVIPASELLEKPASSAALRLRDHIKSQNNPQGWSSRELMINTRQTLFFSKNAAVWCTTTLLTSPLYDTEFDLLGKPRFICPATYGWYREGDFGRAVLYPPLPRHQHRSSATAHLEINPKRLDLLCSDPYFMSLFLDNDPQL